MTIAVVQLYLSLQVLLIDAPQLLLESKLHRVIDKLNDGSQVFIGGLVQQGDVLVAVGEEGVLDE